MANSVCLWFGVFLNEITSVAKVQKPQQMQLSLTMLNSSNSNSTWEELATRKATISTQRHHRESREKLRCALGYYFPKRCCYEAWIFRIVSEVKQSSLQKLARLVKAPHKSWLLKREKLVQMKQAMFSLQKHSHTEKKKTNPNILKEWKQKALKIFP